MRKSFSKEKFINSSKPVYFGMDSIGTRLFLSIMTPVAIGLAGLGILFYFNLEDDKLHNLTDEANLKVKEVDTELRNSEVFLKSLAVAIFNIQNNGVRSPSAYEQLVLSYMSIRPKLITGFGVMQTLNGLVDRQWFGPYIEESIPNRGVKLPEYANYSLVELWQVDRYPELQYYTDAINANKYFWSKPYINDTYPIPLVTFAGPIRDRNGNLIGIVNGDINIRDLNLNDQSKSKEGRYSVFVTQEGILLNYAPEPNKVSRLENIASVPSLKVVWDEIQHALAQGKSQGYFKSNATQSYWVYQRVPSSQWVMLQSITYDTVIKPALLLSFSATLSSAIALAFVVVLFIRYLNRRLHPILEACAIDNDEHIKSKDEISHLTTAFFNMKVRQEHLLEQLQQANVQLIESDRLKDEFIATMSHELRTPLNSILGMNEALQDEVFGSINERQLKALQTIENSSTHLLTLINDILDVAKIESGQITLDLAVTNIESLCTSSLAFIKQQALTKRIQLTARIPKHLPEIRLDERRIRQVLINLLNNAVKFTMEGGTITLEVSQVQLESSPTNLTPLNYIKIAVIDTGIGISAENIQRLFQPFIQIDSALNRQYTGTGLGLALVKRLVELHRGNVELTSEVGVGSCFAFNLPINVGSPAIEEQTENDLSGQPQTGQSQTEEPISPLILLAEDNEANIATFSSYLEAKGYRILLATDGQQAISIAKSDRPDLILMDIQMPVMDGLEAIAQIRLDPSLANIPIIALTALAMEGDREKCLAVGANEYLSKPIKLKALADIIWSILGNRK